MTDADVVVVGAGHNGLIAAAYLAGAGIDTLLLESRTSVGGCASTVADLGARFNICHCEHTLIRGLPVAEELDLAAHGLEYLEPAASMIHTFHDGSDPWVHRHDVEATIDGLAATYPGQVDGYRRYLEDALPVAELAFEMARTRPGATRLAVRAGSRARAAARLLAWSRRSVADVLGDYFDDWRVSMPSMCAAPTTWGVRIDAPGTGLAATNFAGRHLVRSGRPRGGSGALTDAIRASFESRGGRVRCGATVAGLEVRDGAVRGLRLVDGSRIGARTVVAACDPARVFVDWLDDPPARARRLVARWRAMPAPEGYQSKLDVVLSGRPVPRFAGALAAVDASLDPLESSTMLVPSPAGLDEVHRLRAEGRVADHPVILTNVPSVLDDSMAPAPGQHVLSVEVLYTPYGLPGGWPESSEPRRWLELWAETMEPGALDLVDRWRAMTPDRYETEFSMHRGHAPSFSGAPLAALVGRPRELTRYRTPIRGLYLSGAGTFPGAGIFGASGRNAAHRVMTDLRSRWRARAA